MSIHFVGTYSQLPTFRINRDQRKRQCCQIPGSLASLNCLVAAHTFNVHYSTAGHERPPAECHSDSSNPLQTWVYRSG